METNKKREGKFKRKLSFEIEKQSKKVTISMVVIVVISVLFTIKGYAFYDIDGLIRQVNGEMQNFMSNFRSEINNEISAYRSNLEAQLNREIETYRKDLSDQANKDIQEANDKQIRESKAKIEKEKKESNDRINLARAKAESELEEACKALKAEGDE